MFEINLIEWIGYLGSVVVAVSLMMTSMIKLRWLNLIGSIIFTIYGFVINAIPVAAVNLLIVGVNIAFMIKIYTKKDYFKVLEISQTSQYLAFFLEFYQHLISKDFPKLKPIVEYERINVLILRNMAVAGVFLGYRENQQELKIEMDFVIPPYRDFKPGAFLLVENQSFFLDKGINKLSIESVNRRYHQYYRKMGFKDLHGDGQCFVKELI